MQLTKVCVLGEGYEYNLQSSSNLLEIFLKNASKD